MGKAFKRFCLMLLAVLPIASVSFAAKSSLSSAQIRSGVANSGDLISSAIDSGIVDGKRGH